MTTENNFAFIDSNNLYLAIKELGWSSEYLAFVSDLKKKVAYKKKKPHKDETLQGAFHDNSAIIIQNNLPGVNIL